MTESRHDVLGTVAAGGFNCPFCRYYNAIDEKRCAQCGRVLPPPGIAGAIRKLVEQELWGTKVLAGISIVVFALEMATAKSASIMSSPASAIVRFGALAGDLGWVEPWRNLAACFVHIGVLHIAMNMLAFAQLGRIGEAMVGGSRFVITYVVTGVIGFVVSDLWYGSSPPTAGASGAIYGIAGMIVGLLAIKRDPRWKDMLWQLLLWSFVLYFGMHTNQAAHLGGLASGIALGVLFGLERRPWKIAWLVNALAGLCLVASVASIVLSAMSPIWKEVREMERRRDGTNE